MYVLVWYKATLLLLHSIVILAVLFPFTMTDIAVCFILLLSINLKNHNSIITSVTSLYCLRSCAISFHNHRYYCMCHAAAVMIK